MSEVDYTNYSQIASKCEHIHALLSNPQQFLIFGDSGEQQKNSSGTQKEIRGLIQYLFGYMEFLASADDGKERKKGKRKKEEDDTMGASAPLSGLTELYVGEDDAEQAEDDQGSSVDAETIWGQVDIQNEALVARLKQSMKKLSKNTEQYFGAGDENGNETKKGKQHLIRLLDLEELSDSDDEGEKRKDNNDDADDDDDEEDDEESNGDDGEQEDEDAKRIRVRMERTMADMDEDSGNEEFDEGENTGATGSGNKDDESLDDPAAEHLNDGFFNLHEMESFADEEEEYHMPDDDYDEQAERKKLTKLKKNRTRTKEKYDSSSEEDEDEETKLVMDFRRKKYREDEDIDALMSLYNTNQDVDDDVGDEVINMTAVDFFGRPEKKYLSKSKKEYEDKNGKTKKNDKKAASFREESLMVEGDDDDSWGEHKFSDDSDDAGWNAGHLEDDEEREGNSGDEEENVEQEENVAADDSETKPASFSSLKKKKLEEQTKQLELEALAEKPWAMRGETSGSARPVNSLLEATPQFEVSSKVAPVITKEHTESIEEMIKERILAEDWDDVIPRELPDISKMGKIGDLPEVSQEKSKLGLGELYERDYLKKAAGYDTEAAEKNTAEEKAKSEMRVLFASLCSKLDALSNYHFAPRPIEEEAEIHTITTPAIAMEEVLPLHVSDARAVAPEEVYGAKKGRESVLKGESELDQTERKRLRNAKKAARRKARSAKLADEKLISRLEPGLGLNNPYEKRKLREELSRARATGKVVAGEHDKNTDYNTSTKFFKRMQEDVERNLKDENAPSQKRRKMDDSNNRSSKSSALKL